MASKSGIGVKIDKRGLDILRREEPKRAEQLLTAVAEEGVTYAKMKITTSPATGRAYKRGKRIHIASSPGNPSRSDSGSYRASIRQRPAGRLRKEIVSGVEHSEHQEFGTRYIAPRPVFTPMVFYLEQNMADMMESVLDVL